MSGLVGEWVDFGGVVPLRAGAADAAVAAWARIGRPGCWWTGEERRAIADEVRAARCCELCAERKAAVSPYAVEGTHEVAGPLPAPVVDTVHRITTDPGRLTRRWYEDALAAGLTDAEFVELVGVVGTTVAGTTLARAIGASPFPLPDPEPGRPRRDRPEATVELAWVPTCGPDRATGELASEYTAMDYPAAILQALTLVPDEAVSWLRVGAELYVSWDMLMDFSRVPEGRALTRPQVEAVAATVSAANDCFY